MHLGLLSTILWITEINRVSDILIEYLLEAPHQWNSSVTITVIHSIYSTTLQPCSVKQELLPIPLNDNLTICTTISMKYTHFDTDPIKTNQYVLQQHQILNYCQNLPICSTVNMELIDYQRSHHTPNVSLHYHEKHSHISHSKKSTPLALMCGQLSWFLLLLQNSFSQTFPWLSRTKLIVFPD